MPVAGGYDQILQYVNFGEAWYDGLQVAIKKQLSRRLSARTYTWSHDINTVEWDGTGQNPNDYGCLEICEKASSLLNQTNRVSASATYQFPYGFMISAWVQAAPASHTTSPRAWTTTATATPPTGQSSTGW